MIVNSQISSSEVRPSIDVMTRWRAPSASKRGLDAVIAGVGLVIAAPVLGLIALAICLDSRGPILCVQTRVGLNRRPFRMYKFRSMVKDAERTTGPVWATADDPRVTRVGRFLRRTHLDELPQLINVIRGEMSLVGPRPERPDFEERLARRIRGYTERSTVLPGITGIAQLRSGYDCSLTTVRRKLRYDRYYINHSSIALDLRILAATVKTLAGGERAFRLRQANAGMRGDLP